MLSIGQREILGAAAQDRDPGHCLVQLVPHAGRRLHRDNLQAAVAQLPGQLPGARAEVDDPARPGGYQPVDRLGRVGRPAALVGVGRHAERFALNTPPFLE